MFEYLDYSLVIKTLEVPTVSGEEQLMRDYIIKFAQEHSIDYTTDKSGNVYLTKGQVGEEEFYPCVTAHMDSVQYTQSKWISEKRLLDIKTKVVNDVHTFYCEEMGIGADDKSGIAICLSMFENERILKGVFFVMEEAGCLGSENVDLKWFCDVGYIMAFDSPEQDMSWACGGARLFDRKFYEQYLADLTEEFKIRKFCNHPFTDIMHLRENTSLVCLNIFAGYYNYHSPNEYCVAEDMDRAIKLGKTLIKKLAYKEYVIPYTSRMDDVNNEDDVYFYEKFGRDW